MDSRISQVMITSKSPFLYVRAASMLPMETVDLPFGVTIAVGTRLLVSGASFDFGDWTSEMIWSSSL